MSGNIFLIGFMGVGKSTISALVGERTGRICVEMDEMIAEEEGLPIPRIFSERGEAYFRDVESRLLIGLQTRDNLVVSCGGGVALRKENKDYMKKNGKVIWLTAEPETIYERVKDCADRPVLNGNMNVNYIKELMDKRSSYYEEVADMKVGTDGRTAEEICEEIVGLLESITE